MTCKDIIKYIESWAPQEIAWQKDNVGLQVGSTDRKVKNIILSLELTDKVLDDAIKRDCNLIFTHHPLIFNPIKKLDFKNDKNSILIEKLIKHDITLFSAHTNLDFTKEGVSFQLAKKLNLQNINFLLNLKSNQYKIVVFVPSEKVNLVADSMFNAGGGIIGEYASCSFRTEGEGTFLGSGKSNPVVGKKGNLEKVSETKLEVMVDKWKLNSVISEMIKSHPYEEVAYDLYPLDNENINYGAGAIGELQTALSQKEFLLHVSKSLNAHNFRFVNGKSQKIKRVAVCGGSGSDLIKQAVRSKADAFITADLKYHTFHDYNNEILLIDAGHYETEVHVLDEVKKRLTEFVKQSNSKIKILKHRGSTNPIIFYNN